MPLDAECDCNVTGHMQTLDLRKCLLMQNVTAVFLATRKNNFEVLSILLESHADAAVQCDMMHVVRTSTTSTVSVLCWVKCCM